ncbi:phytanoyl-CoA dioxygenase family protein [Chitinophaga horti]|uniref:Phytanoyl-CoA dioxygenase family protein n=1 Tax=Chitinophaga horti TaxID=2920382 RepID=A0ABY6J0G5_9BACT|nr:phytanoyl-CoA dioxygenase family protein [Chitinophaga horti]UYQ91734.1 phytanoyl-CoA dioxygenase family protein [Chitinophaga horti]
MKEVLSTQQIAQFIRDGYVRIDQAFSRETAEAAVNILWKDLPVDRHDPSTWTQPVIRLGMYSQAPFIEAANSTMLQAAFDQLAGVGRWAPCRAMGTFPVRFPAPGEPNDTGWHVDVSFPGDDPTDYFQWRSNIRSKGRALLMLFLFSDTGEQDAPTRILAGSHQDVARVLAPAGDEGLSLMELATQIPGFPARSEVLATGAAGTVYLCHPFLVHAAQPHHGSHPRFLAQPPLFFRGAPEVDAESPVGQAIQLALRK